MFLSLKAYSSEKVAVAEKAENKAASLQEADIKNILKMIERRDFVPATKAINKINLPVEKVLLTILILYNNYYAKKYTSKDVISKKDILAMNEEISRAEAYQKKNGNKFDYIEPGLEEPARLAMKLGVLPNEIKSFFKILDDELYYFLQKTGLNFAEEVIVKYVNYSICKNISETIDKDMAERNVPLEVRMFYMNEGELDMNKTDPELRLWRYEKRIKEYYAQGYKEIADVIIEHLFHKYSDQLSDLDKFVLLIRQGNLNVRMKIKKQSANVVN